ncbi:hypothetical protein HY745_08915 [Candidatus Desantisbacteria bacterium]|nr:hypothetical protein [Candidatus Desantisbacteria bacterium]
MINYSLKIKVILLLFSIIITISFLPISCGGGKGSEKTNDSNNDNDNDKNDTTSHYDTTKQYDTTNLNDTTKIYDTTIHYDTTKAIYSTIGSAGGKITSRDGLMTLEFLTNTLDEDTKIVIINKNKDDLPKQFSAINPDSGYELLPKTLNIKKPVKVTFELPGAVKVTDSTIIIAIPFPAFSNEDKLAWFDSVKLNINNPIHLPTIKKFRKLMEPESFSGQVSGEMPDWANKSGGIGVGGNTTLGGTNGITIRHYVSPDLTSEFNFSLDLGNIPQCSNIT